MSTVEVHLSDDTALGDVLAEMRGWLDRRRYEPSTFRYIFAAHCIVCTIDFASEAEAAEFARAFNGRIVAPTAGPPLTTPP